MNRTPPAVWPLRIPYKGTLLYLRQHNSIINYMQLWKKETGCEMQFVYHSKLKWSILLITFFQNCIFASSYSMSGSLQALATSLASFAFPAFLPFYIVKIVARLILILLTGWFPIMEATGCFRHKERPLKG